MRKSRILKILMIIGIVIVLIGAYTFFFADGGGEENTATESSNTSFVRESFTEESQTAGSADARRLLNLLQNIRTITLDGSIFEDPAFRRLVDFSRPIDKQPLGRDNPFSDTNPFANNVSGQDSN